MPTTTHDMKNLNFGIDRILSDEITPVHFNKPRVNIYPIYPLTYPCTSSFGTNDFHHDEMSQIYYHHVRTQDIVSNFGNVFRNCSNIYKPAPIRPVMKDTLPVSNTTTSPIENSNCRRRSWSRAVFSSLQRKGLEKRFALQKYITKPDRRQLAATLGLTDAQVKVWFQNRRMKWRHTKEDKRSNSVQGNDTNKNASQVSSNNEFQSHVTEDDSDSNDIDVE